MHLHPVTKRTKTTKTSCGKFQVELGTNCRVNQKSSFGFKHIMMSAEFKLLHVRGCVMVHMVVIIIG